MEYSHTSLFTSAFAGLSVAIAGFYGHLAWWLVLGLALVLNDLRFGIKAARVRGEEIRFSRAWRRTVNKTVDYLGWVTVAELLWRTVGTEIGKPVASLGVLFFIYGIELSSCINNYLQYKGLPWRFDFWKLLRRRSKIAADSLESTETKTIKTETDNGTT